VLRASNCFELTKKSDRRRWARSPAATEFKLRVEEEDLGDVEEWETNETAVAGGNRVEVEG